MRRRDVRSLDVGAPQDSSGERIGKAAGQAFEVWTKNSLLKQVTAAASEAGASAEENDKFIIAGCCKEGRLLSLRLFLVGTEMPKHRARELAEEEKAVFVVRLAVKIPAWISASYRQLTVKYDGPELKGVYIAKLQCSEFDPRKDYQLLQTTAVVAVVSDAQWEEAIAAGDGTSQTERIQGQRVVSPSDGKRKPMSTVPKSGVESLKSHNTEEHLVKNKGKNVMLSTDLKGRGVATMFGGMGLGLMIAACTKQSGSFDGLSEGLPEGRKRKFSEDPEDDQAEEAEADDGAHEADEHEDEADRKTKKLKLVLKKPSVQEDSDVPATARGQALPEDIGTPPDEPVSHIDGGSATMYIEAEGKNKWASTAWTERRNAK